jgi:hypothetical protein
MIFSRATIRPWVLCLFLVGVLSIGIVQWSFLPVLIQCPSLGAARDLDASSYHTSKFAAPYKFLTVDSLQLCVLQTGIGAPEIVVRFFPLPAEPLYLPSSQFSSERQLRSPPSL